MRQLTDKRPRPGRARRAVNRGAIALAGGPAEFEEDFEEDEVSFLDDAHDNQPGATDRYSKVSADSRGFLPDPRDLQLGDGQVGRRHAHRFHWGFSLWPNRKHRRGSGGSPVRAAS